MIKYIIKHNNARIEFETEELANEYKSKSPGAIGPDIEDTQDAPEFVEIPQEVPSFRIEFICTKMGIWDDILNLIESLEDQDSKLVATLAIQRGASIERFSPLVKLMQFALSLTEEQVDQIFIQAHSLEI